jgi:GNAT superfamily N-acetyltransferase
VIRPAEPRDVPKILALIKELATYEREPDAVNATESDLTAALFAPEPAVFALMAELDGADSPVVGFAIWFRSFSTWVGRHGLYIEDLYVRPELRGQGHGRALFDALVAIADERGYGRVEWAALDWNEPAHRFYEARGGRRLDDWTTWRLDCAPHPAP